MQELFNATVPVAILAALVAAVASVLFLRTRNLIYDSLALAVTEIGLVLLAAGIAAGVIASGTAQGAWWTWDVRLTAALVCGLLYVPYPMLRHAVEEPSQRASFAAVVSIFACLDVPIVVLAIRWWREHHAGPLVASSGAMNWLAGIAVLAAAIALTRIRVMKEQRRRALDAERRAAQTV